MISKVKKVYLGNDQNQDHVLKSNMETEEISITDNKGGAPRGRPARRTSPPLTRSNSLASAIETSSDTSLDTSSDTSSDNESVCTVDLLSSDPLFLVLSHFFVSKKTGDNIATILEKINSNLEKLAASRS